mgnify:CR=1 FL=1
MISLSPVERVALARTVTGKVLEQARAEVAEGESYTVDFVVRVSGHLTRGHSTPDAESEADAAVELLRPKVVQDILRRLGIGKKRLRSVLQQIVDEAVEAEASAIGDSSVDHEQPLAEVFDEVAAAARERLPKVKRTTNGRAGSITSSLDVTKC